MGGSADAGRTSHSNTSTRKSTPPAQQHGASTPPTGSTKVKQDTNIDGLEKSEFVGSPLKKQRASVSGTDDESLRRRMGGGQLSTGLQEVMTSTAANKDSGEDVPKAESESVKTEKDGKKITEISADIDDEL